MILKLLLSCFSIAPVFGFSGVKESIPEVMILKDSISKKIHPDSMLLVFNVTDAYNQLMLNQHSALIQVKIDGKTRKFTVSDKKRTFRFILSKGTHQLGFYLNANFNEIHFERELKGGHYYEIGLNFMGSVSSGNEIMLEKPVIYLYSENEQPFTLRIETDATLSFTYPVYKTEWKGTSSADGTIRMNNSDYPYLFWDATLPAEALKPDWNSAMQIKGNEAVSYLEQQLTSLGMNQREKTDFITYWGPRMQKWAYVQILWLQNEGIDPLAHLELSPAYKLNRIYLLFTGSDQPVEQTLELKNNVLSPVDRSGNYLIEWGGMELLQTDKL